MSELPFNSIEPSFDEFPIPTYQDWYEAVVASLKGGSFEKKLITTSYEDIDIHPMYFQEDIASLTHPHTLPGQVPHVRGNLSNEWQNAGWLIAQEIPYGLPTEFNNALKGDLANGQNTINLKLDRASRHGIDPTHAGKGDVGRNGVSIASLADLEAALDGIDLQKYPLYVDSGIAGATFFALFHAYCDRNRCSLDQLHLKLGYDPLGTLVTDGTLPKSLRQSYDEMADLIRWTSLLPHFQVIGVYSEPYSEGGANAVQEVAFSLATGIEYIDEMLQRELPLEAIVPKIYFNFKLGSHFFMQIAKLRAARMLWSQIIEGFGGSHEITTMRIHASTLHANMTGFDPYVNILRTATEALSGALGGVESISVSPFDAAINPPTDFSRRVARNQQLILQHEAHITHTLDTAGGSWYVEYLTDQIARKSWTLLQEIESRGGMSHALIADFPQEQIAQVAAKRIHNTHTRKDRIVGTNVYANLQEQPLENTTDFHVRYEQRMAEHHKHITDLPSIAPTEITLESLGRLAAAGATIQQFTQLLNGSEMSAFTKITAVPPLRVTESFEQLRQNALAFKERSGNTPAILMVKLGDDTHYRARIDFTISFFAAGGFEVQEQPAFRSPHEAAIQALESGATAIVICATDDVYRNTIPDIVQAIRTVKPEITLILAGYPEADVAGYRQVGIDIFIHLGANCVEINRDLQARLGIIQ